MKTRILILVGVMAGLSSAIAQEQVTFEWQYVPINPYPSDGAVDVPITTYLSWDLVDSLVSHNQPQYVMLAVEGESFPNFPKLAEGHQSLISYVAGPDYPVRPPVIWPDEIANKMAPLEWGTTYKWRVEFRFLELFKYPNGEIRYREKKMIGPIWTFTTTQPRGELNNIFVNLVSPLNSNFLSDSVRLSWNNPVPGEYILYDVSCWDAEEKYKITKKIVSDDFVVSFVPEIRTGSYSWQIDAWTGDGYKIISPSWSFNFALTSTVEFASNSVDEFQLNQNYPNPFNPTTTISFNLPEPSEVNLTVYNTLGQAVKVLTSAQFNASQHNVIWDGTDTNGNAMPSGVYVYTIKADNFTQTRKMVLAR